MNGPEAPNVRRAALEPTVEAVRGLFSRRSLWQAWLEVESALARAQASLGMIPAAAAQEIARKATLAAIDEEALARDIARTRAPIVSLVRALAGACADDAGGYVHWGATTQNVTQSGRILQLRTAHEALMQRLGGIFERLAALADESADMLVAGRTNRRHALPITFGFKVAAWIEEFLRHEERLAGVEHRAFALLWGGAIGAMHSFGAAGPELNRELARLLGLEAATVPSRAATDHIAEYVLLLALFGSTCSKIAAELYTLMSDEIAEVREDLGDEVVGSSTMPQKVNSKVAVAVIALGARLRAQATLALEATQASHEGDAAHNLMVSALIEEAVPLGFEIAARMEELLSCLRLEPGHMLRNLALSGELIAAENAMMLLAPSMGRAAAPHVVHDGARASATTGESLADILLRDPAVRACVAPEVLRRALDPRHYTGLSEPLARQCAQLARDAAGRCRRPAVRPGK
jgi:3-carboxy-cis,cis-muconate cycloisomerase